MSKTDLVRQIYHNFATGDVGDILEAFDSGIEFRLVQSTGDVLEDKINTIRNTPFSRTLFLDSDTYVFSSLDGVFKLLERVDIALAHEALYTTSGIRSPLKHSLSSTAAS